MGSAQNLKAAPFSIGTIVKPSAVVQHPGNSHVQLALQQSGTILTLVDGVVQPTPYLTVNVDLFSGAAGLLGLCFDPDFASNGYVYVNYSAVGEFMQLSRFHEVPGNPMHADVTSEYPIFRSARPNGDHNAGTIWFGQDKMLYMPTGDGGGHGDPDNRGQDPNDVLGKFLRLDVRSDDFPLDTQRNYHIPSDNPFVDGLPIPARPEIWSFGTRNPWRWSFDDPTKLGTGAMVIADVGEDEREEIDYEPVLAGGRNYGWSRFEGSFLFHSDRALAYGPHTGPVIEITHPNSLSITGGYVYRGLALGEEAWGRYYFSDWVSGALWSVAFLVDPVTGEATATDFRDHTAELGQSLGNVVSVDVDADGELLVSDFTSGQIRKLWRENSSWLTDVARTSGVITGGQVRSLVASDGKSLDVEPFSPFYTNVKATGTLVGFKTNVPGGSSLQFTVRGKVNQSLSVPCTVSVKNWVTNAYDAAGSFSLTGSFVDRTLSVPLSQHVRPSDGRMELKLDTIYSGPLLQPRFVTMWDKASVKVQ